MALIKCPKCGKDISDKAIACVHCGFLISEFIGNEKENINNVSSIDNLEELKNNESNLNAGLPEGSEAEALEKTKRADETIADDTVEQSISENEPEENSVTDEPEKQEQPKKAASEQETELSEGSEITDVEEAKVSDETIADDAVEQSFSEDEPEEISATEEPDDQKQPKEAASEQEAELSKGSETETLEEAEGTDDTIADDKVEQSFSEDEPEEILATEEPDDQKQPKEAASEQEAELSEGSETETLEEAEGTDDTIADDKVEQSFGEDEPEEISATKELDEQKQPKEPWSEQETDPQDDIVEEANDSNKTIDDASTVHNNPKENSHNRARSWILIIVAAIIVVVIIILFAVRFNSGDSSSVSVEEKVEEDDDTVTDQEEVIAEESLEDNSENIESMDQIKADFDSEPIILIDTDDYYVEFRGIEESSDLFWIVDLYVENNTDSDVYIELSEGMVNGYMITFANSYPTITAGSKFISSANNTYVIDVEDLQDYGIEKIESFEFEISFYDTTNGDDIAGASVCIDIEKDVPSSSIKTENVKGEILYDSDGIYIEYRDLYWYYSDIIIDFYIENNTDSDVIISLDNGMVNDFSIPFSNSFITILAESKYLSVPNFDYIINGDDLEACGIETIDSITFDLIISSSFFDYGDISENTINLSPNVKIESQETTNDIY